MDTNQLLRIFPEEVQQQMNLFEYNLVNRIAYKVI